MVAQALFTGVTGLSVNSDNMSVIANNLANANSKGFKRDRAEFEDILAQDLRSGGARSQIGRGSRLSRVKTLHTQGGLQVTDNLTDLAIQGSGFFVALRPGSNILETSGKYFTRVGTLGFDKDGYFSDPNGGRIQGYMADDAGRVSSRLTDIRIETNTLPPRASQNVFLNVQLDSRADVIEKEFDMKTPDDASNFSTSLTVFDSHGRAHLTTVYFKKTSSDLQSSNWEWHAGVDSREVTDPDDGELKFFANGKVTFDKFGLLASEETTQSEVNFSNGAFPGQVIKFDFGQNVGEEKGRGVNVSTSIAGASSAIFNQQDGYEAGQIKTLNITTDGKVVGIFTNGIQRVLAGVALATFPNEDGLVKGGKNQFLGTIESGPANVGTPETGSRGSLLSSTLEESNVDLAGMFVEMIRTQRMFQANSRTITTSDTLVEEIVNLKR